MTTLRRFPNVDPGRESFLEFIDMGNDDDLFKIILNGIDRFDQPFPALAILRAKAFVDDQRL